MGLPRTVTRTATASVVLCGVVLAIASAGPAQAGSTVATGVPHAAVLAVPLPVPDTVVRDGITLQRWRIPTAVTPVHGTGARRSDFDGDGRDDLAVGTTWGVTVSYSSSPYRDRLLTAFPDGGGILSFGQVLVTGNFNGDRYDDLAVADPNEDDTRVGDRQAGAVWIFYGGPGGLQLDSVTHVNQSTAGVPGTSTDYDLFGQALAAGDINGDRRDELAIGIPGKTVADRKNAGAVIVLNGSPTGVTTAGARWITQNTAPVHTAVTRGARFGWSVAIGRVNRDRFSDLAIGAPWQGDGRAAGCGLITLLWGSTTGVTTGRATAVSGWQATIAAKIKGTYVFYLGDNLAIGDTNGDGFGEVIDGAGQGAVHQYTATGLVVSFVGRATGLSAKGVVILSQDSKGVADRAEPDDGFGTAIAVGDVTGDGRADVLVGVPGEDVGTVRDAGAIVLLPGSRTGLTGIGSQTMTQASPPVPGSPKRDNKFGQAVTLLNLDGTGNLDAVVGSPYVELAPDEDGLTSGLITVFTGTRRGLTGPARQIDGRMPGLINDTYGQSLTHP